MYLILPAYNYISSYWLLTNRKETFTDLVGGHETLEATDSV
jgi:hypothetical protein